MLGHGGPERLFAQAYFGVQRVRGGVDEDQIRFARDLLNDDANSLERHVRSRISEIYPVEGDPMVWLRRQGLTDRSELHEPMAAKIGTTSRRLVEVRKTSGSTGAPFRFVKDKRMTAMMDAVMWAVYGWHGIAPGQKHARFWGMPRKRLPRLRRRIIDRFLHRRRLDAFKLTPDTALEFFARLRRFRPQYIHAYPNLLLQFVEYCGAVGFDGHDLGVQTVVCGGELLPPTTRQRLQLFFGARIVNEYGCSESGLISIECEFGRPHLLPVAVYAELANSKEQPDGALTGEVVITDLYGKIMPLLRYRLHDRARLTTHSPCKCGRSMSSLSPVIGREDRFIEMPSGKRIYDAILAYSVPEEVLRFRAYQLDSSSLFVEVVTEGSPEAVLGKLEDAWKRELCTEMSIRATVVDEIPIMESGKLAYFIPEEDVPEAVRKRAQDLEQ